MRKKRGEMKRRRYKKKEKRRQKEVTEVRKSF